MTDETSLRAALRAAVVAQPATLDRVAGVRRVLALRRRRRQRAAATGVALSLVAGLALVTRLGGAAPDRIVAAETPSPEASESPYAELSPSPRPEPTGTPDGTPQPVETSARPSPSGSGDVTIDLTASRTHVRVGDVLRFSAEIDSPSYAPPVAVLDYGDGRVDRNECVPYYDADAKYPKTYEQTAEPSPPDESPSPSEGPVPSLLPSPAPPGVRMAPRKPAPAPLHRIETFDYAFRRAGTFTVVAYAGHGCGDDVEPGVADSVTVVVDPGPGAEAANGPVLPTIGLTAGGWSVTALLADADGYLTRLEIDWGDGREPDVWERDLSGCRDPGADRHWLGSAVHVSSNRDVEGTRELTFTVTTSGCDGTGVQRTTQRFEVSIPAPIA